MRTSVSAGACMSPPAGLWAGWSRPSAHRRPLQHFEIAIGTAEHGDRAVANVRVAADGLACLVDDIDLRQAEQEELAVALLEAGLDRRADDLLGRNAIDAFGP